MVDKEDDDYVCVERDPPLQVFCDYEATTDEEGNQSPILLCLKTDECDQTEFFYGADYTESMLNYLESLAVDEDGDDRRVIVIFHNLKGYDGMFLLQHCYDTHREVTDQITVGTKIFSLTSDRLTFKDSLCFLPFPLSSFPATFGIEELCKGFFPHKFNTVENQDYEGPMPPAEMYDPDGMSAKKKAEFERWYQSKIDENYHFVMRTESDVKLLKSGCQKFRKEFKQHADFDLIAKCVTIASAFNRFWRKKMVPENTIATEPPSGWHGITTNQSFKALKWLKWKEHQLQHQQWIHNGTHDNGNMIRSVANGGEVRVSGWLVDGFDQSDPITNVPTVYEFNGCLWHGCPKCFPSKRESHPIRKSGRSLEEIYEQTKKKERELLIKGYNVVTIWGGEWDKEVKENEDLKEFLKDLEIVEPLRPREAFFGGRTNAVKLHHAAAEGEKIQYIDVTSLYLWVNKT